MNPQKVLITGGSGFVGSHMISRLVDFGYNVASLQQHPPTVPFPGVEAINVDLRNPDALKVLATKWDWVIHLAGASIPSQFHSSDAILLNLALTLNLLEHLQSARVLLVSSCHVYAPSPDLRREDSLIIPQGRYGLSKHLIEQMAGHYGHKLDIRVARPFNHLGPNQRQELVIPSLLKRISEKGNENRNAILMKGTNSTRDFVDVSDVVNAYISILQIDDPSHRVFNVSTGKAVTIKEVAETAFRILGMDREIVFEGHLNSTDDNPYLVGDSTRLQSASTWRPRISLESSLKRMLDTQ